jgi:outer membrane lipoprotein-sorting protein
MRISILLFLTIILPAFCVSQSGEDIIRKSEEKLRGKTTSQSDMTVTTIRPTWQREMSLKSWSKGTDYSLTLITSPAKEKGIAFLKRKKEVWNWMPSIERTIKMPPSMMSQSWMGTDLKNDDLVRESSAIKDYTHSIVGDSTILNRACWKIELIPLPEAAVVWGKVIVFVDQGDYVQMLTQFFDEDGYLVNTMVANEIKVLGGQLLATRLEVIPADESGHKTVMQFNSIIFDQPISDRFFTTQYMKRAK